MKLLNVNVKFSGRYGLSNRIRSMAGHFALSKCLGGNFTYEWSIDPSCPDFFSNLFSSSLALENANFIKNTNSDTLFITYDSKPTNCGSHLSDIFNAYLDIGISIDCLSKYNQEFYKDLRPIHGILNQVIDLRLDSIGSLLGVHVRRTDMIDHCISKGIEPPNDNDIFNAIDAYLYKNPDTMIFLAVDNPQSESLFQKKYPEKIIFQRKNWDLSKSVTSNDSLIQDRMSSLREAIIDLYALSKCDFIIGTKHSSFSTFAAEWGKKKYIRT